MRQVAASTPFAALFIISVPRTMQAQQGASAEGQMAKKNNFNIARYCERMEKYLGDQEGKARIFWEALSFAVTAHQGQRRKSGDVYVSHPLEVARILVEELGVDDPETLAAAVLHDTVEDVPEVTTEVIGEMFGRTVEAIVDGCTKISHFSGDRQTFYKLVHRKIFAEAASRIEVMLIKLADRLHNMRTLNSMPKHKRQKIAEETLDIYAPMAKVLGLFDLKRELYNLALLNKFPRQSQRVLAAIRNLARHENVQTVRKRLEEELHAAWITCEISIVPKGLWAYYDAANKVLHRSIENPLEIVIITNDIQSCYRVLGIVNQTFPPIPRTIRDFIANPKPTGYQCLHARANIKGQNYLCKIKTKEMHQAARAGIVAEWSRQRTVPGSFEKAVTEMLDILGADEGISYRDMIAASGKKEIYTYTPTGDMIPLPKQSIVLDFAFKVHTEIGKRCVSAVVGQQKVDPTHILQDGDRVRIITQEEAVHFEPRIQELCQTPKARSELNRMFRIRREKLAWEIGVSIVQQEMKRYGIPFDVLRKSELSDILEYFNLENTDALFLAVGQGRVRLKELIYEVKSGLYTPHKALQPPTGSLNRIELNSLDPACIKLSRCCNPVPTEKGLFGLLSERGLSVHRHDCATLMSLKLQREDVVELRWKLKETKVTKTQTLLIYDVPTRNRAFMMLSVAPNKMRILEVIRLSRLPARTSAWEVIFRVDNLSSLRSILQHFNKSGLRYEFGLDF